MERKHPLPGNRLMITPDAELADYTGTDRFPDGINPRPPVYTQNLDEATTVTSELGDTGLHRPVLDIDIPAQLIPSSTSGHYHLYLDTSMAWDGVGHLCGIAQRSAGSGHHRARLCQCQS